MEIYLQLALISALSAIPSLVTFLADGTGGMYEEGNANGQTKVPFLVLEPLGWRQSALRGEEIHRWAIRLVNRESGYFTLAQVLDTIATTLHEGTLTLDPAATHGVPDQGVRVVGSLARGYDRVFRAETEAIIIEVRCYRKGVN